MQKYYFNVLYCKIKVKMLKVLCKLYDIIDEVVFWDGKIGQNEILGCECSKEQMKL